MIRSTYDLPALIFTDAGELISACRNIQFLSADNSISQSESVNIRTYLLWMIRGPECRLCWFTTTKTQSINHMGFPYHTTTEDCFTGIQCHVVPHPFFMRYHADQRKGQSTDHDF